MTKDDGGFESMGGKLPGANFDVGDVAKLVGETRMVDVIDVATQSSSQWTLEKWADYVKASSSGEGLEEGEKLGQSNGKVFNVISLEISGTELARKVKPPTIVRYVCVACLTLADSSLARSTGLTTSGTLDPAAKATIPMKI